MDEAKYNICATCNTRSTYVRLMVIQVPIYSIPSTNGMVVFLFMMLG